MINPFRFRPETPEIANEPEAEELDGDTGDWEDNWLSNKKNSDRSPPDASIPSLLRILYFNLSQILAKIRSFDRSPNFPKLLNILIWLVVFFKRGAEASIGS